MSEETEPGRAAASAWNGPRLGVLEALGLLVVTLALAVRFGIPELWFVVPFAVITLTRRAYEEYGLTLEGPGSIRLHVVVSLVALGGYLVAHYAFGRLYLHANFHPTLPPALPRLIFEQILVVGFCEEFFFRGYLQTQLNRWFGRPYRLFGAEWGWGLVIAAVLFGLCHIVNGGVSRLHVTVFGLFAGWLRERTRTIAVPAVYHGVGNVLLDFMVRSFR